MEETNRASWNDLARELDAWEQAGLQPTFWWRDDDAAKPTPSLRKLLALSEHHNVPVSIAVIPAQAHRSLIRLVAECPFVTVLQHGFSHRNYSLRVEPKCELSTQRPVKEVLRELRDGRRKLKKMFPDVFLDVLVPPWGRVSKGVVLNLVDAGFVGISTGDGDDQEPVGGLRRVNVHVDIVDWRLAPVGLPAVFAKATELVGIAQPTCGFVGLSSALDQVVNHLRRRRTGVVKRDQPTGLMTHHRAHDESCWNFVNDFLAHTRGHAFRCSG